MQEIEFSKSELLEGLDDSVKQLLALRSRTLYFKKGTIIFNSLSNDAVFFYILRGWVKLFTETAEGTEVVNDVLSKDNYFGEHLAIGIDSGDYCAQAITDVKVMSFPVETLRTLLTTEKRLALNFFKSAMLRQQKLARQVEHLSTQTTTQRIGCFLLTLSGCKDTENIDLQFPYDKSLIASRLGMRPETFSRALGKLSEQHAITVSSDTVQIPRLHDLVDHVCIGCSQTYPCRDMSN